MLGLAARSDVQVGLVAQDAGRLHRIAQIILREFLQSVVGLLVDQVPLLDPAFQAAGRAHTRESLLAVDNLDTLSILHVSNAVVDGRNLVPQRGLRRRNIGYFEDAMASMPAAGKRHYAA
jgi:hypothetical protein